MFFYPVPGLVLLLLICPLLALWAPNSVYILNGICPSLATVNLSKLWVLAFSPVASLIFGRMCWSKHDCWSTVTLLPEFNKDRIWIPWTRMHTLEHLATAICMILILVSAEMGAFFNWKIKSFSSLSGWGLLSISPFSWSMTKGGLSFPDFWVANQAVYFPRPVFCLV